MKKISVLLMVIFLTILFLKQEAMAQNNNSVIGMDWEREALLDNLPEVELFWKNGEHQFVQLIRVEDDSLYFQMNGAVSGKALDELSQMSLVRHGSLGRVLGFGLGGGAVGYLIGFASGDDEPGLFSFTAEEKAMMLGGGISLGTFLVGGTIELIRETDVDVPLSGFNVNERRKRIQSVLEGTYHSAHPIILGVFANYLKYDNGLAVPAYQLSAYLPLKPRLWFGLQLGMAHWSDWYTRDSFHSEYEDDLYQEKYQLYYLSVQFRSLFQVTGRFVPYFQWGLAIGMENIKYKNQYIRYGEDPEINEYKESYSEQGAGITAGFGVTISLYKNINLDTQASYMLRKTSFARLQLGIQFKL